jgi:subtilisin family serine protease
MAALIAGQGGGRTGFMGIAPAAKILPIHDAARLDDKYGLYESYARGIRFAVDHGAKVINFSQGVTSVMLDRHCEPGVQDAIAYAADHDVIVVASTGNTGNTTNWPELPASCAGVLTVGAIGPTLRPWVGTSGSRMSPSPRPVTRCRRSARRACCSRTARARAPRRR